MEQSQIVTSCSEERAARAARLSFLTPIKFLMCDVIFLCRRAG